MQDLTFQLRMDPDILYLYQTSIKTHLKLVSLSAIRKIKNVRLAIQKRRKQIGLMQQSLISQKKIR